MGGRAGSKKETLVRASNVNITTKDSKDVKIIEEITEEIVFDDLIAEKCGSNNEKDTNDFPDVHVTERELRSLSDNEMISNVIINVLSK